MRARTIKLADPLPQDCTILREYGAAGRLSKSQIEEGIRTLVEANLPGGVVPFASS